MKRKKSKKGVAIETLIFWIIAIAVLVFMVIVFVYLKGKGYSAIGFIKDLFRFGR